MNGKGTSFAQLNQQRIHNEARALLLDGQFNIVHGEIHIGPFRFPYDMLHLMEVVNVMEGRLTEQAQIIEAQDQEREHLKHRLRSLGVTEEEIARLEEDD